jgi:hypothetical protein
MAAMCIAVIVASVLATAVPVVSGVALMVVRKESVYRYPLGVCLIVLGIAVFFLNPFSNVMASFLIDDHHLSKLESRCLGRDAEALCGYWREPDNISTNDYGTYLWYRKTSPCWSMWQQDTVVLMSNGVAVKMWHDD